MQGRRVRVVEAQPRRASMGGEHWRAHAACRGADPEVWFPVQSSAGAAADATRVCRGCPVRVQCLRHALAFCEQFGVWGGLTERELRALRKQRRLAIQAQRAASAAALDTKEAPA